MRMQSVCNHQEERGGQTDFANIPISPFDSNELWRRIATTNYRTAARTRAILSRQRPEPQYHVNAVPMQVAPADYQHATAERGRQERLQLGDPPLFSFLVECIGLVGKYHDIGTELDRINSSVVTG